jgi:hypothetical protein
VLILRALIGVVTLTSAVVTGFFCLKWIYRVSLNAHSLVKGLTITPGWAIGWYFVPIALLFKPFQALKEAWQASANPLAWRSVDTPGVLRWWWGLWLLSSVLSNISLRLGLEAKSVDMLVVTDGIDAAAAMVGIPLNLVFIQIVRRLSANQVGALSQRVFA